MNKMKVTHGQLYKNALWATVIVFCLATLITIFAVLFDGFTSFTFRMLFVMWQVFWFGLLAMLFARFYESNTFVVARYVAVAAVIGCALLLVIGVYQAFFPEAYTYNSYGVRHMRSRDEFILKIQYVVTIFVYVAVFIEWHLRVRSDVQAVIVARDITAGVMALVVLVLDMMILAEYEDLGGIMGRLIVVMIILAMTGAIVTRILASIYTKNQKQTEATQYSQFSGGNAVADTVKPQNIQPQMGSDSVAGVNRAYLAQRLQEVTGMSKEECIVVMNVFENGFLLGKQSREELAGEVMSRLTMSEDKASRAYDEYISIVMSEFLRR